MTTKTLEIQMAITNLKQTIREWGETKTPEDWSRVLSAINLHTDSIVKTLPPRIEVKQVEVVREVPTAVPEAAVELRVEVPVTVEKEVRVDVPVPFKQEVVKEVQVPVYVFVPSASDIPEAAQGG